MKKLICWLMLAIMLALIGCAQKYERRELASLFNDSEGEGSFFLGCGSINEVEYLFAWVRDEDGVGWFRLQAAMYTCRIYTDEDESPYVMMGWEGGVYDGPAYLFHVPHDTIIRRYEVK